jgi:GNAT superfamily N-acetyltransferase
LFVANNGSHMEIITDQQLTAADKSQLGRLLHACFGEMEFEIGPQATIRAILRAGNGIVAHAAVSIRQIDLHTSEEEIAVLGLVCVEPSERGKGFGYQVIQSLHGSLRMPFLLNCGRGLVPYYEKIGYKEISACASYFRDGKTVIDTDPVLLYENGISILTDMRNWPIYIGTDF